MRIIQGEDPQPVYTARLAHAVTMEGVLAKQHGFQISIGMDHLTQWKMLLRRLREILARLMSAGVKFAALLKGDKL